MRAPAARRSERGSALLVVVMMAAALVAISTSLIGRASLAASELRARRAVLCARYTALGGLALGTPMTGAESIVSPRASSLDVRLVRLTPAWCVLRATAACDGAMRTIDRTLPDPSTCDAASP